MKVCIPYSDLQVSRNFGKAAAFALVVIEDGHIASTEILPNPGHGKVKVPVFLGAFGITHVIAAGIGNPAVAILNEQGIEVYTGATGRADQVLDRFLRGELRSKKMSCAGENRCGAQHPKD